MNIYGPSKAVISQVDSEYLSVAQDLFNSAYKAHAQNSHDWVNFKSKDYKNVKYSLVHNIGGIGYAVYRNDGNKKVEVRFTLEGSKIDQCKILVIFSRF